MSLVKKRLLFSLCVIGGLAGCQGQMAPSGYGYMSTHQVAFSHLSGWEQEDHSALIPLMRRECHHMAQLPPETKLGGSFTLPAGHKVADWAAACAALPEAGIVTEGEARRYFETWFRPYEVRAGGYYTGYYEPQFEASLEHVGPYKVTIYRRPPDLLRLKSETGEIVYGRNVDGVLQPYDDRAAIDNGSLIGKHLEVAWMKSPVDLLFLQIQGVGRLHLPNGHVVRVAYDGQNGQPYVPIGKILVDKGVMQPEEITGDHIRTWLEAHPREVKETLEQNPNYVFLRLVEHSAIEGPNGAFGVPLSAGRSVAIDRKLVPFAAPIWIESPMPEFIPSSVAQGNGEATQLSFGQWNHLAFAQDTGTDIHGAGRADIFTGWGDKARFIAGHLQAHGRMVVFVPRKEGGAIQDEHPSEGAISRDGAAITIRPASSTLSASVPSDGLPSEEMSSRDIAARWAARASSAPSAASMSSGSSIPGMSASDIAARWASKNSASSATP